MGFTTSHRAHVLNAKSFEGQFVQSQLLRAWKLRLTTSRGFQVPNPRYLRSICAISAVGGMEVGTYHFTHVTSHFRSICAILAIEIMEVGTYHFTRVPSHLRAYVQSQPLRAWKLRLTTSQGSQVLNPKSF